MTGEFEGLQPLDDAWRADVSMRRFYQTIIFDRIKDEGYDPIMRSFQILRDANAEGSKVTIPEVYERLSEEMLIVGDIKEVGLAQLNDLMQCYWLSKPVWDSVLRGWEQRDDKTGS